METRPAAIVANIAICLIHQTNYLLDQQIRRLEGDFIREGGLRERMTALGCGSEITLVVNREVRDSDRRRRGQALEQRHAKDVKRPWTLPKWWTAGGSWSFHQRPGGEFLTAQARQPYTPRS